MVRYTVHIRYLMYLSHFHFRMDSSECNSMGNWAATVFIEKTIQNILQNTSMLSSKKVKTRQRYQRWAQRLHKSLCDRRYIYHFFPKTDRVLLMTKRILYKSISKVANQDTILLIKISQLCFLLSWFENPGWKISFQWLNVIHSIKE